MLKTLLAISFQKIANIVLDSHFWEKNKSPHGNKSPKKKGGTYWLQIVVYDILL
jgi:hypothetical protein